jgi:hypothetical protein
MNENFVVKVWFHGACLLDQFLQFHACAVVFLTLCVNHVDQSATLGDLSLEVILEHVVSREVDHVEVDVVVRIDLLVVDLRSWLQEERLVWCKLLEDHFLNGGFACPKMMIGVSGICVLTSACP